MFNRKRSIPSPGKPSARDLLPWYVNQTANSTERRQVEDWLKQEPDAARQLQVWQQVRKAVRAQPRTAPAPVVRRRLAAQIASKSTAQLQPTAAPRWLSLAGGLGVALSMLILLWAVMRPGISLQWSVSGQSPAAFQLYRAPVGSDRFELVSVVHAQPNMQNYTFVDTTLWPGQAYRYRVEAPNQAVVSDTIAVNGMDLLPIQLAIVLSSLFTGVAVAYALRQLTRSSGLTIQEIG